jgi:hypothetical protein
MRRLDGIRVGSQVRAVFCPDTGRAAMQRFEHDLLIGPTVQNPSAEAIPRTRPRVRGDTPDDSQPLKCATRREREP